MTDNEDDGRVGREEGREEHTEDSVLGGDTELGEATPQAGLVIGDGNTTLQDT